MSSAVFSVSTFVGYPAYRVEFGSAAQVASEGLEKGFFVVLHQQWVLAV
jgi:hypothetical protein